MQKEKKIKVGMMMPLAYPLFNSASDIVFGGAEVDMHTLAVKLSQMPQYEVTFYTGDFGQKRVEYYNGIKVKKVRFLASKTKNSVWHKAVRHFAIWLNLVASDANIFIMETANELVGWVGLLHKRLKRKIFIHRLAHDDDTVYDKGRSRKSALLYKLGLNSADLLLTQTEQQKDMLKTNTGLESIIIKNGLFVDEKKACQKEDYILWVARCTPFKRPLILLKLAQMLPEENFVMIMPLNHASDKNISQTLNDLNAEVLEQLRNQPNVRHIEYVPFHQIQAYYDKAKLFVNTSYNEGFPNAFVQACLGRTPILSFNVNADDFIQENNLGYFCNDDIEAAAEFIKSLTPEKVEALGNNAFQYVKKTHDIDEIAKQYDGIIKKLVS